MNFKTSNTLFYFSIKLIYRKDKINLLTGEVSLSIEVYLRGKGYKDRPRFPLNLRWPADKVDRPGNKLLPRFKDDKLAMDYNMMITAEIAKVNEVIVMYRLSNRALDEANLLRELKLIEVCGTLVGYMAFQAREMYVKQLKSYQTYRNYFATINRIIEFDPNVTFSQMTTQWIDDFKVFLKKKKNSHNTIWTRIKDLKYFLGLASKEASIYVDEKAVDYPNQPIIKPPVYLDREEIKAMIKLFNDPLTDIEVNVLKAFLFQCFTSLRISDVYKANKSWMMSDNFAMFTMQKNIDRAPKTIKIPIVPMARQFISQSLNQFFELPTTQEYNRTIKDLAIRAGIRKNVHSHVGRHTFGFLFMTSVGDIYALQKIMGHSKISTTQIYAHINDQYKLDQALKIQEGFKLVM